MITGPRRFTPPLAMVEALDWMESFLANAGVGVIEPASEASAQTMRWMRQFALGPKRILDTHLAAVLHGAGVRRLLTSNPDDFAVFGVFELIKP